MSLILPVVSNLIPLISKQLISKAADKNNGENTNSEVSSLLFSYMDASYDMYSYNRS